MAIEEFKTWKCSRCGRVFHGTEAPKSCSECDKTTNKYKRAEIKPYVIGESRGIALYYDNQPIASTCNDRECNMLEAMAQQLNDCIDNGP